MLQSVITERPLNTSSLTQHNPAVVQTFYHGQRLYDKTLRTQAIASVLESFFYEETHSGQLGPRLPYKIDNPPGGIAVGQKIIYEKHLVAGA